MNCERCQNEIEDFLYGELDGARAAGIRAHLTNCAACAAAREDLERENELFAQFYEQTAIEPASEMWEPIRARINTAPQSQTQSEIGWLERLRKGMSGWLFAPAQTALLRQASFAILLIALSVAITTIYLKRSEKDAGDVAGGGDKITPATTPQQVSTPIPSPSTDIAGGQKPIKNGSSPKGGPPAIHRAAPARQLTDQEMMNQQIARAEREYQKAIRMLDQAIAKRRGGLDPALVKQYESSLALIDGSIASSRRALRQRPDDPTAGQFLLAAYAKKLDLMQDVAMQ